VVVVLEIRRSAYCLKGERRSGELTLGKCVGVMMTWWLGGRESWRKSRRTRVLRI